VHGQSCSRVARITRARTLLLSPFRVRSGSRSRRRTSQSVEAIRKHRLRSKSFLSEPLLKWQIRSLRVFLKRHLPILRLLPEDALLETMRSSSGGEWNERRFGCPCTERVEKGAIQSDLSIGLGRKKAFARISEHLLKSRYLTRQTWLGTVNDLRR
jgi:hypothetical protein